MAKYLRLRVNPIERNPDTKALERELAQVMTVVERIRRQHELDPAALVAMMRENVKAGDVDHG